MAYKAHTSAQIQALVASELRAAAITEPPIPVERLARLPRLAPAVRAVRRGYVWPHRPRG